MRDVEDAAPAVGWDEAMEAAPTPEVFVDAPVVQPTSNATATTAASAAPFQARPMSRIRCCTRRCVLITRSPLFLHGLPSYREAWQAALTPSVVG